MKTLILDGLFVYKDLPQSFDNNNRSIDLIFEKAKKNNFDRYILLQNGKITNIPDGIKNIVVDKLYPSVILSEIIKEAKNNDSIVIMNVGNPFYDNDFIDEMFKRHEKYIADYTYCIGYPVGLAPEIIRKDIIKELINLVKDDKTVRKDYLFYSISKDINSFDIETILSDYDVRIFRVSVGINDIGEEIITKNFYTIFKNDFNYQKIVEYINNNPQKLFTTVYLLILELTNYSTVSSIYYPKNKEDHLQLDFNNIKKIILDFKKINENIHVVLGGIGEPLEHENFIDILKYIVNNNINVIIETTGYSIDESFINKISNIDKMKISFVIKYDAYEEKTYSMIHPEADFNQIKNSIELLKKAGFNVYKQIIRMVENEVEIEKFIRKKEVDDLIIRKYSTYCDMIQDKKVVDLAPLKRIPCYHLRREFYIKADGTVPVCMYGRYMKNTIGDIKKDDIELIIKKLEDLYIKDAKNEHLEFCKNCNDYYLFNF